MKFWIERINSIVFFHAIILKGEAVGGRAEAGKPARVLGRIIKNLFSPMALIPPHRVYLPI